VKLQECSTTPGTLFLKDDKVPTFGRGMKFYGVESSCELIDENVDNRYKVVEVDSYFCL
jgi:hypothetical protein